MKRYIETNFSAKWTIMAVAIAVGLAVAAQAALPSPISAEPPTGWGCQFDADSIDPISYRFYSVTPPYKRAFEDAKDAWNDTSAPGYFGHQAWSFDPEVSVIDGFLRQNWWALAAVVDFDCDRDETYSGNEVTIAFNSRIMDGLKANERAIVAMHELGHAYGLGHSLAGCYVMRQGHYKFTCDTMPTSGDVSAVDSLY